MTSAEKALGIDSHPLTTASPRPQIFLSVFSRTVLSPLRRPPLRVMCGRMVLYSPRAVRPDVPFGMGRPWMRFNRLSSLFAQDLAVDLGTANTLVFVRGRGIVINEPSIVAVQQSDRSVL